MTSKPTALKVLARSVKRIWKWVRGTYRLQMAREDAYAAFLYWEGERTAIFDIETLWTDGKLVMPDGQSRLFREITTGGHARLCDRAFRLCRRLDRLVDWCDHTESESVPTPDEFWGYEGRRRRENALLEHSDWLRSSLHKGTTRNAEIH